MWLTDVTWSFTAPGSTTWAYGQPRLIATLKGTAGRSDVRTVRFANEPAVALAEKLAAVAPDAGFHACPKRGLGFNTTCGNVLTLSPPLTDAEAEIEEALAVLDAASGEVQASL